MRTFVIALCAILPVALVCGRESQAGDLTLVEYIGQVKGSNKAIDASRQTIRATEGLEGMGTLLLAPTLEARFSLLRDKKPQPNPAFQGYETDGESYELGVSKLTTFGLSARLAYVLQHGNILGAAPGFIPLPNYYEARPVLELSQSLWKNGFGAATRAEQAKLEAVQLANRFAESYKTRVEVATAEMGYYRLALARESVRLARDNLARAEKIKEWNARRVRLQLADRTDLLQAEAVRQLRELELQTTLDEERAAARAFNAGRERDSDTVEPIAPVAVEHVLKILPPERAPVRDDVKAAEQNERIALADAEGTLQMLSPDITMFGSAALNGRRGTAGDAVHDSFTGIYPTWTFGLKLTAPLDLPQILRSRRGAHAQQAAAAATVERKRFEADNDWKELVRSFGEAKKRLALSHSIENVQREKLTHEKDRALKGRSTVFQVLTFEQDYALALLTRIRAENEVLRTVTQMKTYGGDAVVAPGSDGAAKKGISKEDINAFALVRGGSL